MALQAWLHETQFQSTKGSPSGHSNCDSFTALSQGNHRPPLTTDNSPVRSHKMHSDQQRRCLSDVSVSKWSAGPFSSLNMQAESENPQSRATLGYDPTSSCSIEDDRDATIRNEEIDVLQRIQVRPLRELSLLLSCGCIITSC